MTWYKMFAQKYFLFSTNFSRNKRGMLPNSGSTLTKLRLRLHCCLPFWDSLSVVKFGLQSFRGVRIWRITRNFFFVFTIKRLSIAYMWVIIFIEKNKNSINQQIYKIDCPLHFFVHSTRMKFFILEEKWNDQTWIND